MGALLEVAGNAAGKVGAAALTAAEEQAKNAANAVVDRHSSWWSDDDVASADLYRFEQEPDVYKQVVEGRLVKEPAGDPDMQRELTALLEETGPTVEVLQSIAVANGVTGARVEEMLRGTLRVEQHVGAGPGCTGADIRQLG
jgi:hypothetical protein